jgi:hypothetical protein
VYSDANGLLGNSPIIRGRGEAGRVHRIVAFAGRSLSVAPIAAALVQLASSAFESDSAAVGFAALPHRGHGAALRSVRGRAQAVALAFGQGGWSLPARRRSSRQVLELDKHGDPALRFGMNVPGNDDKQLVLNFLHPSSRALN